MNRTNNHQADVYRTDDHQVGNHRVSMFTRLRNNKTLQRLLRVFQFLCAAVSLGLFSARLYSILKLNNRASTSNGAVEGILSAAVAYGLLTVALKFGLRNGGPNALRWLLVLLDILFVGAFIAVAYLTRPSGGGRKGSSGPCRKTLYTPIIPKGQNCHLPWGTFIGAIISTILYSITAIIHEVSEHHARRKEEKDIASQTEASRNNSRYSS